VWGIFPLTFSAKIFRVWKVKTQEAKKEMLGGVMWEGCQIFLQTHVTFLSSFLKTCAGILGRKPCEAPRKCEESWGSWKISKG